MALKWVIMVFGIKLVLIMAEPAILGPVIIFSMSPLAFHFEFIYGKKASANFLVLNINIFPKKNLKKNFKLVLRRSVLSWDKHFWQMVHGFNHS